MSTERFLIFGLVLAASTLVYALAMPHPKPVLLEDVANKTMCPIHVEINDNPDRIPRRIKFLKCASGPNRLCAEQHLSHGCCKHHHHAYVTECVEIHDWVQVTYKSSSKPDTIKVPVGCTCLIEESKPASETP